MPENDASATHDGCAPLIEADWDAGAARAPMTASPRA